MNEPREPLHQPPNSADLRRVPPTNPDCARVRGLLRDFADQDLAPVEIKEVEEHAHRCRVCAVELARAEHEVLRLRQAFAELASAEAAANGGHPATLSPGFAARVVERLVLDETSSLSLEVLATAKQDVPRADAAGARGGQRRRLAFRPTLLVATALALVLGLGVGFEFLSNLAIGPHREARLVVVQADQTFAEAGQLQVGAGLGEQESLYVRPGGGARVVWHDPSTKAQPAATLQVHGSAQVRLESGAPSIIEGRADIVTNRPVSIPMGDGSRLDLGVGEYSVVAEAKSPGFDEALLLGQDPLAELARGLSIGIMVQHGEPATIVRSAVGPTLVAAGQFGVYQGHGEATVSSIIGGASTSLGGQPEVREPVASSDNRGSWLLGHTFDSAGHPTVGADVLVSLGVDSAILNGHRVSGADGAFTLATSGPITTTYVVRLGSPPAARGELGILAPDAVPILHRGSYVQIAAPLVFETAAPLLGVVRNEMGLPMAGQTLVPCIVDEWFGCVLPLVSNRTTTGPDGTFQINRLPARLPVHQGMVLLVLNAGNAPATVPVPTRGELAANLPSEPIVVRQLRSIRLSNLPANTAIEVLEELPGLPEGSAHCRRVATTDGQGRVAMIAVGYERLWYRVVGSPLLRELVLEDVAGLPRYKPASGPASPYGSVFRGMLAIPGTPVEVVSSWRHQLMQPVAAEMAMGSGVLQMVDELGRAVVGAQIFAVDRSGPRGSANARFLGFSSNLGLVAFSGGDTAEGAVALAADGSCAFVAQPLSAGMVVSLPLQAPGRVLLHPTLRPEGVQVVPLYFSRAEATLPGLSPVAVRFASAPDWEVTGLAPGDYRVTVGSTTVSITVPAGGWADLQ